MTRWNDTANNPWADLMTLGPRLRSKQSAIRWRWVLSLRFRGLSPSLASRWGHITLRKTSSVGIIAV